MYPLIIMSHNGSYFETTYRIRIINPIMIGSSMAGANLPAKKYKKTNPTQTRLSFECSGGATQFIDIAKALSTINRKFYRQGVYYYVNSVEVYNNETGVVDLHTIPDTWVTKNAWNRGFNIFQKMNALAPDVPRPKYHDFKVYLNPLHKDTGSLEPRLHDINNASASGGMTADNWDYSQFTSADDDGDGIQDADNFFATMLGGHVGTPDNWTSIGLIRSYGDSRALPQANDPVLPVEISADPLVNLFDMSSEEMINDIVERLDADNDSTPYESQVYIGDSSNMMQQVARLGTEVGVGRVSRASGFCAPFGLICVDPFGVETNFRVVLNLAQGTYHGVYAERV